MLLETVGAMRIVENQSSGKYYRTTAIQQKEKTRIRPLELFPTGILVPKCMDTLVESDTVVKDRCRWNQAVRIHDGRPSQSREQYEAELVRKLVDLDDLNDEYDDLPRNGKGHLSRGSHANKILAVSRRIETLYLGLGLREEPTPTVCGFAPGARVLLPSGLFGTFECAIELGQIVYGRVRIFSKLLQVPIEVLRDAESHRLSVA